MKRILFCLAAVAALATSCKIDRDYDLDRPIDTHMVLLGNDYISFDENGNIVLDFTDNPELVFQFDLKGLKMKKQDRSRLPFRIGNRYGHRQYHSFFLQR